MATTRERPEAVPKWRFEWERLMKRADLPHPTFSVGICLATWANKVGLRVLPGEDLVARCCGLKKRAVREHIGFLRDLGLITLVRGHGTVYESNEYRLTWPADVDLIRMRLDPDGNLLVAEDDWCTVGDLRRARDKHDRDWSEAFRYQCPETFPRGAAYWHPSAATQPGPFGGEWHEGAGTDDADAGDGPAEGAPAPEAYGHGGAATPDAATDAQGHRGAGTESGGAEPYGHSGAATSDPADDPYRHGGAATAAVDNPSYGHSGAAADPEDDQAYRHPGAPVPAPGRMRTGTPVPPISFTTQHHPKTSLGLGGHLTSHARSKNQDHNIAHPDEITSAQYLAAWGALMELPDRGAALLDTARQVCADRGITPSRRYLAVLAASYAPPTPGPHPTPEES